MELKIKQLLKVSETEAIAVTEEGSLYLYKFEAGNAGTGTWSRIEGPHGAIEATPNEITLPSDDKDWSFR